jgi:hypothetical protein
MVNSASGFLPGLRQAGTRRRHSQKTARPAADPADLATKHRILVPEHQELGILGHLTPGQHPQAAEQTTNEQVDDRNDHSAMIPAGKSVQAKIQ